MGSRDGWLVILGTKFRSRLSLDALGQDNICRTLDTSSANWGEYLIHGIMVRLDKSMKTIWDTPSFRYGSHPCFSFGAQKIDIVLRQNLSQLWVRWILIPCVETQGGGHLGQERASSGQLLYLEGDVFVAQTRGRACNGLFHHPLMDCFESLTVQGEIEASRGNF